MPTIGVTGATGQLGRLVLTELLDRGVPAADLVALARTPAKAADLAARGVEVRAADYDDEPTLPAALAGVRTLLLISGSEPGRRVPQHRAVIQAAAAAGVGRIAYTSLLRADRTENALAPEHKATEETLAASGLGVTVLRNGWYIENYTGQLPTYLATGEIVDATGGARVAAATRADYAAAAAAVLTGDGHTGKVYELGGTPFTLAELARVVTEVTGTPVVERPVTTTELARILTQSAGMPAATAEFVARLDADAARGDLDTDSDDLPTLIGRPSTPLVDAVRAAVPS